MIYAAIVAGGKGLRMKNADMPKQFLEIGGTPVLVRTVKAFIDCDKIDRVYVGINLDWKNYAENMFEEYKISREKTVILSGGKNRNETIFNIVKCISAENEISQGDIILTHDGVRPFVSRKIIEDNITAVEMHKACGTYIPAVDTVVESKDAVTVGKSLDRSILYQAQTPQSFNLLMLKKIMDEMTSEEAEKFTDVCGIFSSKGISVKMVMGQRENFKITTDYDLVIADAVASNVNKL